MKERKLTKRIQKKKKKKKELENDVSLIHVQDFARAIANVKYFSERITKEGMMIGGLSLSLSSTFKAHKSLIFHLNVCISQSREDWSPLKRPQSFQRQQLLV